MKRIIIFLAILLLTLLTATACKIIPHSHSYFEWQISVPATCQSDGIKTRTCLDAGCGRTQEVKYTDMDNHIEKTIPGKAATCTTAGTGDSVVCEGCGKVLKGATVIPPSHSFNESTRTCSGCGKGRFYVTLRDHILSRGTYDYSDNTYTLDGGSYSSGDDVYKIQYSFDSSESEVLLSLFLYDESFTALFTIYITPNNVSTHNYTYVDTYEDYMIGVITASTYTTDTLLGYSSNNGSTASMRETIRELGSNLADILLASVESEKGSLGISITDIGFTSFLD